MTPDAPPHGAPATLPAELRPLAGGDPARLGPLRVVGRLHADENTTVYGAVDERERCVAVRVLAPRQADRPGLRDRLAHHVARLRQVRARCVAAFVAADSHAPAPWVATEYVAGRSLGAHVDAHGPLSEEHLLTYATGIAEALAALHEAGLVHGNLHPGNILLSPTGPILLPPDLDHIPAGDGERPAWVPPEHVDDAEATAAGDVYAWGALVAFAAGSQLPAGRGDAAARRQRARTGAPELPELPAGLRPLVAAALATDPAQRPTAAETADGLLAATGFTEAERGELSRRQMLADLLEMAWSDIDAAGHDPDRWRAVAELLDEDAASGAGDAAGTAHPTMAGTGRRRSVPRMVAVAGAALVALAVVATAGFLAGRATGVAGPAAVDSSPAAAPTSADPDDSDSGSDSAADTAAPPPEGQLVEFRTMRLWVPEEWEVTEEGDGVEGSLVLDTADSDCDTELAQANGQQQRAQVSACGTVVLYGPERISPEDGAPPQWDGDLSEDRPASNRTDLSPCLPGMEFPEDAAEADRAQAVQEEDTVEVGAHLAHYREWILTCAPYLFVPPPQEELGGLPAFVQRTWYLPESRIFVVDEWGTAELPDILAEAEVA